MSSNFHLPAVQLAHAIPQKCETHGASGACSEFWYPAGPEMNTELAVIFTDATAELANLQSASPSIDFTDTPISPSILPGMIASPNFLVTAPVHQAGYYEVQFHLANNFWGCSFSFGNSACGVQIRQGIAHMIDKTSFAANDPNIASVATPIDNPLPTTNGGGLPSPNPCAYDASFPQSGSQCIVGAQGGTSYHLAAATGANGLPWLPAPGSLDLNAAAQHFVNAGLATGFNSATSILTGITVPQCPNCPVFYIRNDDTARNDLGHSLAEQICYLFTGSYAFPCNYLNTVLGAIGTFPGYTTSTNGVNLNWWMYTAAYSYVPFFDSSLYFTYNSRFVSGIPPIQLPSGPCSSQAVATAQAPNYMYLCSPTYDSLSSQMENAPCLSAPGDPSPGSTNNGPGADCPTTSQLSAISAGIQTEANFGGNAFTIPIFERTIQFAYLNNGWVRAINDNDVGLPNYFTWLNAWNPAPAQPGTIRQGFSQSTRSVSPYIASTAQDLYIVQNVYDSLYRPDPLAPTQSIDWMTTVTSKLSNAQVTSQYSFTPPGSTSANFLFTLHNDIFFQDQQPVSAFDVAFSYLSMVGNGAFLGSGASSMTYIAITGTYQFIIGVSSSGPFAQTNAASPILAPPNLTSLPVVPGRYWTGAGASSWDSAITDSTTGQLKAYLTCGTTCPVTELTLRGNTVSCAAGTTCTLGTGATSATSLLTVDPAKVSATFDPISSHDFIGSGPWQCGTGTLTKAGSALCTSTGAQNPPPGGSYTLTAFGAGVAPASSLTQAYFRSPGNLALYLWSEQVSGSANGIATIVATCLSLPPLPISGAPVAGSCAHFQQGIGVNGATTTNGTFSFTCPPSPPYPAPGHPECVPNGQPGGQTITWTCSPTSPCGFSVGVSQFSVQVRYYAVNWVAPFQWPTSPPLGIGSITPVLYQGGTTLNPASVAGCSSPYPTGGYDC